MDFHLQDIIGSIQTDEREKQRFVTVGGSAAHGKAKARQGMA